MPIGLEATSNPTSDLEATLERGRYDLQETIGVGAMGAVYRARQIALGRDVAIKLIHAHLAADARFVAAFLREARAGAIIEHPNVVRTLDVGRDKAGRCFIVMELLTGQSLSYVLDRMPVPPAEWTILIVAQVLAALGAAHDRNIIHRDIKPANIMVQRVQDDDGCSADVIKLSDFGIARVPGAPMVDDEGRPLTFEGTMCGTPGYMSPEQCRGGQDIDARSDIFSVGVLLYEMITGEPPFEGERRLETGFAPAYRPFARPSELRADVNPELERVTMRALQKEPSDRYASARAMRRDLLACLASVRGDATTPPDPAEETPAAAREDSRPSEPWDLHSAVTVPRLQRASRQPAPQKRGLALVVCACCMLLLAAGTIWLLLPRLEPHLEHAVSALTGSPFPIAAIAESVLARSTQSVQE